MDKHGKDPELGNLESKKGQDAELTGEQSGEDINENTDQDSTQENQQAQPKNTGIAIVNLDSDSPEVKEVLRTDVSIEDIKSALKNPDDITDKPWSEIKNTQTPSGGGRRRSHRRKSSNNKRSKSRKGSRKRKGSRRRK